MSFSGKKFKRVRTENMDALLAATDLSENVKQMLHGHSPTFSFTRLDEDNFNFRLEMENRVISLDFKLGEESETQRRDGSKVKVTYTLENDNVLRQTTKAQDGKVAHFRREFGDNGAKMTIQVEGIDIQATVYYELVE